MGWHRTNTALQVTGAVPSLSHAPLQDHRANNLSLRLGEELAPEGRGSSPVTGKVQSQVWATKHRRGEVIMATIEEHTQRLAEQFVLFAGMATKGVTEDIRQRGHYTAGVLHGLLNPLAHLLTEENLTRCQDAARSLRYTMPQAVDTSASR